MGSELPPSKFGAGYTYGGGVPPAPVPVPVQPAPFQPTPTPDPSAYPQAYSAPTVAQPAGYATTPAYPAAYPIPMKQQYAGSGGTAITASVLSFLSVLVNGMYAAIGVMALIGLATLAASSRSVGDHGTIGLTLALSTVMAIGPIVLLIGGIQLLMHKRSGRWKIVVGSLLTIAGPSAFLLVSFGVLQGLSSLSGGMGTVEGAAQSKAFHQMATTFVLLNGAPIALALLTIILTLAPATRRWCEAVHPTYAP